MPVFSYVSGDILQAEVEALVNPVNCVGVMGAGLALQFKQAFPDNFRAYQMVCTANNLYPTRPFVYDRAVPRHRYIINFATKYRWNDKSKLEDISFGLHYLRAKILDLNINSIAIPKLGCGLGGLQWADVRPLIEYVLSKLNTCDIRIYGEP